MVRFKHQWTILNIFDKCPNIKRECQKQITLIPEIFELECNGSKNKVKLMFKRTAKAWNKFLNLAVTVAAPFIGIAVGDKTENHKLDQATTNKQKSITGG